MGCRARGRAWLRASVRHVDLERVRTRLSDTASLRPVGRVTGVAGLLVRAAVPGVRVGDILTIRRRGGPLLAEIVGLTATEALALPHGDWTSLELIRHGEAKPLLASLEADIAKE